MSAKLPFDERNAQDYREITSRIEEALAVLKRDVRQPATKSNLARLSCVHRNTLYNRAMTSSPDGNPNNGWPFAPLREIKKARTRSQTSAGPTTDSASSGAGRNALSVSDRLARSRYEAGRWFHRSLELKKERDEARRQTQLMLSKIDSLEDEVARLRKQLVESVKVVTK